MNKYLTILILLAVIFFYCSKPKPQFSGELKKWHKITLTFDGPNTSELEEPNPFMNYRLNVKFTNGDKQYVIPGYYAADGKAAFTSAFSGNKWRVHFSPDEIGEWTYQVSFKKGNKIAVTEDEGESASHMDGVKGTFTVEETDKTGNDLRGKGRLKYVKEHYLKFAETNEYFIKCGADSPENFLAFFEIDETPNVANRLKKWEDHAKDYHQDADDYLWGAEKQKGKNILGSINYLASKGMNAFSFLTFNIDGDDRNVFPHLLKVDLKEYEDSANIKKNPTQWEQLTFQDRFDVSKMDQWEQIFSYADLKGMFLHFKLQETENDQDMDGGELGDTRKIYFREMIARYGHHLALNWNLGEENTQTTQQLKDLAEYFSKKDPYNHLIVVHTYSKQHEKVYLPLLGSNSELTGASIQTNMPDFSRVHGVVKKWVAASDSAGKKWVVSVDEPGDATHALLTDDEDPEHNNARINGLWGTLMAGGAGTEWYFGYKHPHSDLTCQSFRSRDLFWNQCKIALDFFKNNNIPLLEMRSVDDLTTTENDYVFAKSGEIYLIYSKSEERINIELPDVGYTATWFNPKTGHSHTIPYISENEFMEYEKPSEQDWLLYLRK